MLFIPRSNCLNTHEYVYTSTWTCTCIVSHVVSWMTIYVVICDLQIAKYTRNKQITQYFDTSIISIRAVIVKLLMFHEFRIMKLKLHSSIKSLQLPGKKPLTSYRLCSRGRACEKMILKRGNEQKETGFVTNRSCSRGLSLKSQNATNWVRKIEVNRTRRRLPTLMVTDVGSVYSLVDPAHKIASCPIPGRDYRRFE